MAPPGEKRANYADRCAPGQRARGCMVTRGRSGARFLTKLLCGPGPYTGVYFG